MVADGEELGGVTQGAWLIQSHRVAKADRIAHDVVHLTHVEGELGAILTAKSRAFRDGVVDLQLCRHLAIGLGRIGVHRRQAMCVRIVDGRDEVDVEVVLFARVHRLEAHIVGTLHLKNGAKAFLRIAQRRQQGTAFLVDEVVDGRGVVDLVGIFSTKSPVTVAEVDASSSRTHIFRDVVEGALVGLFLTDEAAAESHGELRLVEGCDALVEVPLGISATHDATIVVGIEVSFQIRCPKITLASIYGLQGDALSRAQHHTSAAQGIIHTQRPFLISAECQSTTKLVIDVADGHADEAIVVGGEEISQTHAIQLATETVQLRHEGLETHSGREVAIGVVYLTKAIDTQFLAIEVGDTDTLVKHIVLRIGLETAADLGILNEILGLCHKAAQDAKGQKQK